MSLEIELDLYAPNFASVLPPEITLDHFKRMVMTAVNLKPELRRADRRSFFNSCVKCAADGLVPDGREATLNVYRTKIKDDKGQERYADVVQYLPMIAGIRRRMLNSGEVLSTTAEVVYRNDKYRSFKGDNARIEHEPCSLSDDPGAPIGAYAIIKLANGEVLRDEMRFKEIEQARSQSKMPNSLMWTKFWGEGAKKTVLRRCAKGAPTSSTLSRILERDNEAPELPPVEHMQLVPPRPRRETFDEDTGEIVSEPSSLPAEGNEPSLPDEIIDDLVMRARAAALHGSQSLIDFWETLSDEETNLLADKKRELWSAAKAADQRHPPDDPAEPPRQDTADDTPLGGEDAPYREYRI